MDNLWNDVNAYLQPGFNQINTLQFLLIAAAAAYMLHGWGQVFILSIGATAMHIVFDALIPVLANSAEFRLPPLDDSQYWRYVAALYVGYVVVVTAFYVVKRLIMRAQHQTA